MEHKKKIKVVCDDCGKTSIPKRDRKYGVPLCRHCGSNCVCKAKARKT